MALTTIAGLFGERHGAGAPRVLALHGWGRDHSDFSRVLHDVPSIALDLPGFGATPAPDVPIGSSSYADAVAPVLDEFDDSPIVIGHSFGGRVALHLAARGLVANLVLIGTPLVKTGSPRRPPLAYRLTKRLEFLLGDERMEQARQRYGSADYRAATGVMRDILVTVVNESYEQILPVVECPTLLIWGAQDEEVPVSVAHEALGLLPNARLVVMPDVGHLMLSRAPDAVRAALREFV